MTDSRNATLDHILKIYYTLNYINKSEKKTCISISIDDRKVRDKS